ncbi:MAG TPA: AlkA N-terminal domain-containing protein [Bryobacteraceae bacterium]|jgi:AraC family transcriptional regulator of adaptative response / DNA-3-methyladenine glycosylase II|nr:AlkA N-terminal domain-containing protein [Bryobacteraceae bacterium]
MELDRDACYRALLTRDKRFDGRMFTAVKSTGVYCRPICPARTPKQENCLFFASAAAAQGAGFRPCLRCRPEVSPRLAAAHGTSNTVSRALRLIENGAANDQDLEALAARLGVGDRHLRRLFQTHVGISPKSVLQTRRVLFAKQLITDTAMPLADVALASGFASLRTFNHSMRGVYGRTPSEFRRARAAPDAQGIRLLLPYSPPYDWNGILRFLAPRAIPGVETVEEGKYRRSIELGARYGLIEVARAQDAVAVSIQFPDVRALPEIVRRVTALFDLGAHPSSIAAHLSKDPMLAPSVAERPGLRVPGAWDGFEMAIRAILGQQISVSAATKLAGILVAALGRALNESQFAFPDAAEVAASDLAFLRMPESRKRTIRALAGAVALNPAFFDSSQPLESAIEQLCGIPGIGEWTAHYIAMRTLRQPDAFPANDVGLLRAFAKQGLALNAKQLLERSQQWRPWRAYAALHLWSFL